jgi:uncharacterized protein involved in exopolysaccharide biosynthesis
MSTLPTAPSSVPPPAEPAPAASDYVRATELLGLVARAPLRRRRLAAAVFGLAVAVSVATAALVPRVYAVDTKILTQRNLVMPSLGNPRRSVPMESDAPTRAAADVILGRDNLLAIVREANLVERWEAERSMMLRLKDRAVRAVRPSPTDEDKERAIVTVLEKKLSVQADDAIIRISVEWPSPQTAYEIVSLAQRNFLAGRSAVEVAIIADTIGILTVEAGRQREAVDAAFARVVQLRKASLDTTEQAAPPAAAPASTPRLVAAPAPAPKPAAPVDPKIATQLEDKRRAIRAIEEPRQQRIAELEARRARLLMTFTEAHPEVVQVDAELKAARVEPSVLAELRREEAELVTKLNEMAAPEPGRARPRPRMVLVTPASPSSPAAPVADVLTREEEPELADAKARLQVATRRYEDLMDRIDSARIELDTAQAAFKYRYNVVEPPELPREVARPNAVMIALGGILLGALLAFFVAAAGDLASGRFVEAWQVRRKLSIPLLAEIPQP